MNSPTALAAQSMGLALPDLPPATATGPCGLCGAWLQAGVTPAKAYLPSVDFGAADHLHPNRASQICQACAVATTSSSGLLTRYSRAVFTPAGAFRMSSAEDVSWMLMNAQPPFVAIFNTKSSAHILWQAPVTHDRRAIGIALGQLIGTIRPAAVLAAREALQRLAVVANEALQSHYQWPVLNLTLYDDAPDICRLIPSHERVLRQSELADVQQDLHAVDDINLPERWALAALLLARPKRAQSIADFQQPPIIEKAAP